MKLNKLLYRLSITGEDEITCAEVHELIDEFAEMEIRGEDAARLMPLVQKHFELCNDCSEEHEALLEVLAFEEKLD